MNPTEKSNKQEEEELTKKTNSEQEKYTDFAQGEKDGSSQDKSQQEESICKEKQTSSADNTNQQLEEACAKIEDLQDKYLRLSAEFDNYRKRTLKEKTELIKNGGEKAIISFLPIMDDLERAIKNMEGNESITAMKEGVELIYNKFLKIMGENGVRQMEPKGKDFNTDYYEAIATVPAPSEEMKGKVLDCVQPGYTLNDKVIRHAKVVVGE